MIRFLAKILIQHSENTSDPAVRRQYGVLCGVVGVVLNVLLFAAKWLAGVMAGSMAVMADAFNNLSDAGSSVITLIGFKISGKRYDSEHPFGHGRVEYIAGLIVSLIIIVMGFNLACDSVEKIFHPEAVEFSWLSLGVLAASILVKLYMALYNISIGKKIQSVAMRATATDSLSDAVATFAVLLSVLIGHFTHVNIDAWASALVSLMILRAGYCAARDTISPLLGNPPDPAFVQHVTDIVNGYDEVRGIHDLVVHDYGAGRVMISLHAEVSADGDLMELHDVIDIIERRLSRELNCEAVIHMDPISTNDGHVTEVREEVLAVLREKLNPETTIHDFRMVSGPTHTNVIFDAVLPMDEPRSDAELCKEIQKLVEEMEGSYFAVVTIDHPYA